MARPMKLIFAALASLVLTVAVLELVLPLLHSRFASYFRRSINPSSLKAAEAQRFFDSNRFDPELGWDKAPIVRNYIATKPYFAAVIR